MMMSNANVKLTSKKAAIEWAQSLPDDEAPNARAKGPAACGRSRLSDELAAVPPEPTFNERKRND